MRQLIHFHREISRSRFLKWGAGLVGAGAATAFLPGLLNSSLPELAGLSADQYRGLHAVAEVLAPGLRRFRPEQGPKNSGAGQRARDDEAFDVALAIDRMLFARNDRIQMQAAMDQLLWLPTSRVAAFVLDRSITPLMDLPVEDRRARLLAWKDSQDPMKIAAYGGLKGLVSTIAAADPELQARAGYSPADYYSVYYRK